MDQYKKIRKLAKQLKRWDDLHGQIIAKLEMKKDPGLLINIHLLEEEIGLALAVLDRMPAQWMARSLGIEAAKAAKKQYPHEAIRLFNKEAEHIMDSRDRGNYSQAAQYLREVRDIYTQLNETLSWSKLITDVRERYKKLPALQDELNRLKL